MQFGIIGLGRMGANLARHGLEKGHQIVGYDAGQQATMTLAAEGVEAAASVAELAGKLRT